VPVHCVRFSIGLDVCISRAEKQFNGAALELNILSIKGAAARLEEIQFSENFDSIIWHEISEWSEAFPIVC